MISFVTALPLLLSAATAPMVPPPATSGPSKSAASTPASASAAAAGLKKSVVVVRVTGQDPDWRAPWNKASPWQRTYTGVVVEGRRVLVTATGLGNATLVELQRNGEEQRYPARITLVDYEGPLALLEADDATFFDGLTPLPLAAEMPVDGEVTVHRWLASNQFESARGVVRQVRVEDHGTSRVGVLTLDVTANVSGGGASEVMVFNGACVGLATSKNDDVMLAIGAPVLRTFLQAAAKKPYPGLARVGLSWEKLLNPALRQHLGLKPQDGGILINRVLPNGSAATALKSGDVLLAVGGLPVDVSGQVDHKRYGKLPFSLVFTLGVLPGDRLPTTVLRDGKRLDVQLTLTRLTAEMDRVPAYVFDTPAQYLVRGGLVFQHLTIPYLQTYGDWRRRGPMSLLIAQDLYGAWPETPGQRMVVLTSVLPDKVNLGYQDERDLLVKTVNGQAIQTLADVRAAFATPPASGFHVVVFSPGQSLTRLVLDDKELVDAANRIQEQYGVPLDH